MSVEREILDILKSLQSDVAALKVAHQQTMAEIRGIQHQQELAGIQRGSQTHLLESSQRNLLRLDGGLDRVEQNERNLQREMSNLGRDLRELKQQYLQIEKSLKTLGEEQQIRQRIEGLQQRVERLENRNYLPPS